MQAVWPARVLPLRGVALQPVRASALCSREQRSHASKEAGRKSGVVPQTDSSSRVQPAFIAAESKARGAGDTSVSCKQFWQMAATKFNDQDWQVLAFTV